MIRRLRRNAPNGYKRLLQVCGLYIWLPPAILELLETWDTSYTLKNNSKPSKEQIDHILRFSTCFVSVSARLALEWVSEWVSEWARLCALCLGSRREPPLVLGVPAPWSLGGLPASSSTLRLGVEQRRHLCAGDVETPTLLGEAP